MEEFYQRCPEAVAVVTDDGHLVSTNLRFQRTVGPCETLLEGVDLLKSCIGMYASSSD